MKANFSQRLDKAVASIRQITDFEPSLALVAGSGLSGLFEQIDVELIIPYSKIAQFPISTAPSHKGELIFGRLGGVNVVAQNGRFHLYEGWNSDDVVLPVYTLNALGASTFILTNAAGALNKDYAVADIMVIKDHLNFMGVHPLAGTNDETLGPRFPDMSRAYAPELINAAHQSAQNQNLALREGVYAAVHGPEFETSAERRFLIMSGGDAVGMSSVPEVIAANHCGMSVLGFSAITNAATGAEDQMPDTIEEVLENAGIAAKKLKKIIVQMIRNGSFK